MNVYIQGLSALAHYRSSYAKTDVERCPSDIRSLAEATSSRAAIGDVGLWRLGIGDPSPSRPLEVLVRSSDQRSRSKAVRARIWKGPVALTAFRNACKNVYVSSPEFVFLQMATRLNLPELVELGMELCGTYRRNVEVPHLDSDEVAFVTVYHQPPLSTPKRLKGFLDSMQSAPGCARALKALQYVLPNSASPIETVLYLLLCLPRRLGGYALPKPILNPPIAFSKSGKQHTLRGSAKPDLYWKDARLDLEYNSAEFHDENRRAIDSMRRKALERMNVEVIEITPDELFSTELFHATVLRIARRLKKRLRAESEGGFAERRSSLRTKLLFGVAAASPDAQTHLESQPAIDAYDSGATDLPIASVWQDVAPDDAWLETPWDDGETWTAEAGSWDDDGLYVFGGSSQKQK